MLTNDKAVVHSSRACDWGTNREMFAALDREFHFCLDAAASPWSAKCASWIGPEHKIANQRDALTADWLGIIEAILDPQERVTPPVFINPPWSREQDIRIEPFIETAARWAQRGLTVVGICPASIQTVWWREFIRNGPLKANEIRHIPHRVNFEASPETLAAINEKRAVLGKESVTEAWGAGGNTAVVIWRPDPGYVGDWQPSERYWTWR